MKSDDLFIIIDGHSLMYRAFYALPSSLMNKDGLHTNVIYGFVNMINKLIEQYNPKYLAVAFDTKAPTFRHERFEDYKIQRLKMPEDMAEQIPYLKQILDAMQIKRIEIDGYEADDIIGTLSNITDIKNVSTLIVTGDRDTFQLISQNVHVLITRKGISETEEFDRKKVIEYYGITPEQVVDLKGLMGDASDNIPGVPGVGEKTALGLLDQFKSIEDILNNIGQIKKNKVRENIEKNKEKAKMSKELATISKDVPIDAEISKYIYKGPDHEELINLYQELGFKSLLEKAKMLYDVPVLEKEEIEVSFMFLEKEEEIEELYQVIKKEKIFAFKISNLSDFIYYSVGKKQFVLPINKNTKPIIKIIMEDEQIEKAGHDLKTDIISLRNIDIIVESIRFDSMIGAYLLNPSKGNYKLKNIYKEFIGIDISDYEGRDVGHSNFCVSVKAIWDLIKPIEGEIEEKGMHNLFHNIEIPLITVLADMEHNGFKVDEVRLNELSIEYSDRIEKITEEIYEKTKEKFNINSTKQLGVVLFEKLKLPPIKKTKTGYSTDAEVLEALYDKHPVIEKIQLYRKLLKLKSTYIDGLMNLINPNTGRIYSKLNQTITATGRLSSTDPNLQNIPIKTEDGREIRKAFVPQNEDYVLVDADYSQIELRVLAHISGDEGLIDSFKNNEDIHQRTAAEVFGVDKDMVTPLMRNRAKAVNFGIVYGISDFGLSKDLKISRKEARVYIDSYFERYPKVKEYMNAITCSGKDKGYVKTLLNRIRYIPELSSRNAIQRNFGERMAMNTPIQGSAADIIKIAMVNIYKELKVKGFKSKLILQVHDELIVETHKDEVAEVVELVRTKMESALTLKVPLAVDLKIGNSWFETM